MDLSIFMSCYRALIFFCAALWLDRGKQHVVYLPALVWNWCCALGVVHRFTAEVKRTTTCYHLFFYPLLNVSNCSMVPWSFRSILGYSEPGEKKIVSTVLNQMSQVSFPSGFCISESFWQGFFHCFATGKSYWGYKMFHCWRRSRTGKVRTCNCCVNSFKGITLLKRPVCG